MIDFVGKIAHLSSISIFVPAADCFEYAAAGDVGLGGG